MRRRIRLPNRSPREWAVRAALLVGVALLGWCSIARTLAWTERTRAANSAYALAPGDGRIAALLAEKLSAADADDASRKRADSLARAALLREPTAVLAVTTLGIDASLRGDQARAERLFAYARTLSRRELRTQLWSIEAATGRNDIPGALHFYDIALRTSDGLSDILFPVLTSAIAEPAVRGSLIQTLAAGAPWTQAFVEHLVSSDMDPATRADFFNGLRAAGVTISAHADAAAVNALLDHNRFEPAWRYYAAVRHASDRRLSRDPRFTAHLDYPSAFDWIASNNPGVSTSMQQGDAGGLFDFAAPPTVGGLLLRQMQFLPPGEYVLDGHGTGIDQPPASIPYWSLSCVGGEEIGRVPAGSEKDRHGSFSGRFKVPEGCDVQYLSLVALPSDMVSGLHGQIDRVQLRPAP